MSLLTTTDYAALLSNGREQRRHGATGKALDLKPVVKLFNPIGTGTWLLTEILPGDTDIAFGLCDLGEPELGYVSLNELQSIRLPFGLRIERDHLWKARKTLRAYAKEARRLGAIAA